MKNFTYLILFLSICFGCLFYACNSTDNNRLPEPKIYCGVSKISGQFRGFNKLKQSGDNFSISCAVSKPLTGEYETINTEIKDDGSFFLEIPIETSSTIGYLSLF